MSRAVRLAAAATFLAAWSAFGAEPSRAAFVTQVTPVVTPIAGGRYSYTYTVTNTPLSTVDLGAFYVGVTDDANLDSITEPAGFLPIYTPGFETIEFASTDASTDITPGSSGTFSFTSPLAPALTAYANQSYDDGSFDSGTTLAPNSSPVPEPATACSAALGGVWLLGRRRRRST